MNPSLIISIGALICVALTGYFGIVRRASGKIKTSEAEQLWEESRSIRQWATNRISQLNKIVEKLETKVLYLEEHNTSLSLENGRLDLMLDEHTQTISELRNQIHRLSEENVKLQNENKILRTRVTELEISDSGT